MSILVVVATKTEQALEVEAIYRRGVWAVTPDLNADGRFVLTHVPSGGCLFTPIGSLTSEEAIVACRMFGERAEDWESGAEFGRVPGVNASEVEPLREASIAFDAWRKSQAQEAQASR